MNARLLHTPEGVRDIYGEEFARKEAVENLLQQKLRSFGYQDIQTPTFEYFDVFSSEIGTTPSKELYKFFDKEGNTLVLRPDFTPSMARCTAKYFAEMNGPLRFGYVGNTFTNTSNLQGKLKEVTQIGAELMGDGSAEADGEVIALLISCLLSTGLKEFQVALGDVDYFKGVCEAAGIDEDTETTLRDYVSSKNYFAAEELLAECDVADRYKDVLLKCADMLGSMDSLKEAKALVDNEKSIQAIARLEQVYEVLRLYGVEKYVSFDLGLLSKYKYYTGIIFKAYTYGIGDAVVTGGRYDTLLARFGKPMCAIGFMIVVDDLLNALSRQQIKVSYDYQFSRLTYTKENFHEKLKEATERRAKGEKIELIPEETTNE
ncbi:MAG: ATP phosphoribosyltransferase regulatory subunit [Lachnospiraceae bacterium]|nr:ATP phosphoribosyltransferase regulatory subunit [Lachnospiraceae bacterium]